MGVIDITVFADTFVRMQAPNTNFDNAVVLVTNNDVGNEAYAILQFSLHECKGKKIKKVTLYYSGKSQNSYMLEVPVYLRTIETDMEICSLCTYSNIGGYATVGAKENKGKITIYSNTFGTYQIDVTSYINTNNDIYTVGLQGVGMVIGSLEGGRHAYLRVEYEEIEAVAPTLKYPIDVYLNQQEIITLSWVHNSESGAMQFTADVEWKIKDSSTWNTIITSEASYSFSIGELPKGVIEWRVRTTDTAFKISSYSYASFIVIGQPPIPVITYITNSTLPIITWQATEQTQYDLTISKDGVVLISEQKNTQDTTYYINQFLENGTYMVNLRIKNVYDIWSNHTSRVFSVQANKPEKPSIEVIVKNQVVTIISHYVGRAILYRKEENGTYQALCKMNGNVYIDYTLKSGVVYSYYVRNYTDGYNQSDEKKVKVYYSGFCLTDGIDRVMFEYSKEEYIPFTEKYTLEKQLINYVGRPYPVRETGEFINHVVNRVAVIPEKDFEILKSFYLSNKVLYYCDNRNRSFCCDLTDIEVKRVHFDRFYEINMELIEVYNDAEVRLHEET